MHKIHFAINGVNHTLDESSITADTTVYEYLRYHDNLCGTKAMCQEGGCGACVVALTRTHPVTKEKSTMAINSCLVYILSCDGCELTTVEGIGNRKDGYHLLQKRLASFNGTQCGFCSPGWIMSMYCLTKDSKQVSSKIVENSFASNLCRCTAYRPILDAFKSFASDAPSELKLKIMDMEDLDTIKCVRKNSLPSGEWCMIDHGSPNRTLKEVALGNSTWIKAFSVEDVFETLRNRNLKDYRFVNGNTGKGVYPNTFEKGVLIDISSIPSLKDIYSDVNMVLGAGLTLTETMAAFSTWAKKDDFKYLEEFQKHLDLVAHIPVRNVGTLAGNLAMKNEHKDFQSDVFVLLATVDAIISTVDAASSKHGLSAADFLKADLSGRLITVIKLPPQSSKCLIRTYKIMPRAQNAHAIMNAGFLFKLDDKNNIEKCNIVYGAVSPNFVHATKTENALKGLPLFDNTTLGKALAELMDELKPMDIVGEASVYCKKMVALGLFYKSLLSLAPTEKVSPRYRSGGAIFDRGVSSGKQSYDTDKSLWPLNQPIPKLEALQQCSGEATYSDDVDASSREVHVAMVLSTICKGEIDHIDATDVLKTPGVMAVLTAKDIPGKNTFTPLKVPWQTVNEPILASKEISHYGQAIAIVAATTRKLALQAAERVKVAYKNVVKNLVLSVDDALKASDCNRRVFEAFKMEPKEKGSDTTKTIKGTFYVPSQYHFYMETQTCRANVTEFGVDLCVSTQWVDLINVAVAEMLGIQENMVNITVPRLGGGYGGKASRSSQFACACALVASHLNRPARLVLPITDNMQAVGKRQPCKADFELGVNDDGEIQYLNLTYYSDNGSSANDGASIGPHLSSLYDTSRFNVKGYFVITDKANNTWCRAPGSTEATSIMEHIMERIAVATKKSPIDVRIKNMTKNNAPLLNMINTYITEEKYNERQIQVKKFNSDNAWRKRSLKLSTIAFPLDYAYNFAVTLSVYHGDGSVAISHGGIEMGQGINTKTAQVCAYTLKIPLEKVSVKASNNFVSANSMCSNGSYTSESVAFATIKACEELLARLQSVKDKLNEPTWEEIVTKAYDDGINLQASYMYSANDNLKGYTVYGLASAEVELDVLTGRHEILRVDLLEDTGQSISPEIDVGQVEGAFLMGVGMWTSEELKYDPASGRLATDRTWTYKPPGAKDIPIDMRINFKQSSPNKNGVLRSKATGEPAVNLAITVGNAIHEAIMEARKEYGYQDSEWIQMDTPYSVQNILAAIQPQVDKFNF